MLRDNAGSFLEPDVFLSAAAEMVGKNVKGTCTGRGRHHLPGNVVISPLAAHLERETEIGCDGAFAQVLPEFVPGTADNRRYNPRGPDTVAGRVRSDSHAEEGPAAPPSSLTSRNTISPSGTGLVPVMVSSVVKWSTRGWSRLPDFDSCS